MYFVIYMRSPLPLLVLLLLLKLFLIVCCALSLVKWMIRPHFEQRLLVYIHNIDACVVWMIFFFFAICHEVEYITHIILKAYILCEIPWNFLKCSKKNTLMEDGNDKEEENLESHNETHSASQTSMVYHVHVWCSLLLYIKNKKKHFFSFLGVHKRDYIILLHQFTIPLRY